MRTATIFLMNYRSFLHPKIYINLEIMLTLYKKKNACNKPNSNLTVWISYFLKRRLLYLSAVPGLVGSSFWWKMSETVEAGEYLQRGRLSPRRMIWLLPHPLPPLPFASCLSFSIFLCTTSRVYWREKGVGGGGGAKCYEGEKARSSTNHLILSGCLTQPRNR